MLFWLFNCWLILRLRKESEMKLEKKYIMHFRYLVKEIMVSLLKLLPISIRTSKMFSKLLKISSKLMQTFSEIILKLLFNRHQYLLLKLDQASMLQGQYQVKKILELVNFISVKIPKKHTLQWYNFQRTYKKIGYKNLQLSRRE